MRSAPPAWHAQLRVPSLLARRRRRGIAADFADFTSRTWLARDRFALLQQPASTTPTLDAACTRFPARHCRAPRAQARRGKDRECGNMPRAAMSSRGVETGSGSTRLFIDCTASAACSPSRRCTPATRTEPCCPATARLRCRWRRWGRRAVHRVSRTRPLALADSVAAPRRNRLVYPAATCRDEQWPAQARRRRAAAARAVARAFQGGRR